MNTLSLTTDHWPPRIMEYLLDGLVNESNF